MMLFEINSRRSLHGIFSKTPSDPVHSLVQLQLLGSVLENIILVISLHEMRKFYADQTNQHSLLVQFIEELFYFFNQGVVERSVRNSCLQRVRIKIGVTDFHSDA